MLSDLDMEVPISQLRSEHTVVSCQLLNSQLCQGFVEVRSQMVPISILKWFLLHIPNCIQYYFPVIENGQTYFLLLY